MNGEKPVVYMAGPVKEKADSGRAWRESVAEEYGEDLDVLDPLAKYDPDDDQDWSAGRIVREDLQLIDAADAVLVRYNGAPTWGTPMEVHYAQTSSYTPVFLAWRADSRLSPWTQYFADVVRPSVHQAIGTLLGWWYGPDGVLSGIESLVGVAPYDPSDDLRAHTVSADGGEL